jgi:DNA-binding transcriptional LysR family regulator
MDYEQLPHLGTFVKAAELSSFTAAAAALGLTQAAVSQRIRALEEALRVALFRRQAGHVFLTEAGQRLFPYAQRIRRLHQEARQAVTGQKAPLTGELALAASSVPGEHVLPALLAVFHEKYPHIQVRVVVIDSLAVLRQVEHGQVQLGLVGGKGDSANLVFRPFARDELVLVVPPGHPWQKRRRVSLKQFGAQPLVLREAGSGSRWCLERALDRAGQSAQDLHVALELGSNEAIKEAVLRGVGLAVLSDQVVQKEVAAGQLHAVRVTGLPLEREMFVVWDRRRALSIPAQLFRDFVAPGPGAAPPA